MIKMDSNYSFNSNDFRSPYFITNTGLLDIPIGTMLKISDISHICVQTFTFFYLETFLLVFSEVRGTQFFICVV